MPSGCQRTVRVTPAGCAGIVQVWNPCPVGTSLAAVLGSGGDLDADSCFCHDSPHVVAALYRSYTQRHKFQPLLEWNRFLRRRIRFWRKRFRTVFARESDLRHGRPERSRVRPKANEPVSLRTACFRPVWAGADRKAVSCQFDRGDAVRGRVSQPCHASHCCFWNITIVAATRWPRCSTCFPPTAGVWPARRCSMSSSTAPCGSAPSSLPTLSRLHRAQLDGTLVESGRHDDLVRAGGEFAKLRNFQV
jgi:hypothetical protein